MKSFSNLSRRLIALLTISVFACVLVTGCSSPDGNSDSESDGQGSGLPKMTFHKPSSFPLAVSRLQVIHDSLIATGPLPEPQEFEVLEIIHGEGSGAHSHYHLAFEADEDHEHHDDHEEMTSSEKTHHITVDVFTEIQDIAKWLPDIAAGSDLDEKSWNQVKQQSERLGELLNDMKSEESDAKRRRAYQDHRDKIAETLATLSSLVPASEQDSDSKTP